MCFTVSGVQQVAQIALCLHWEHVCVRACVCVCFTCIYKTWFLFMQVFIFQKHAKLNRFVSVTLHCFLHSLRCSRAVSYTELVILHAWYCRVILLWSRYRGYANSINSSNGTVLQKLLTVIDDVNVFFVFLVCCSCFSLLFLKTCLHLFNVFLFVNQCF